MEFPRPILFMTIAIFLNIDAADFADAQTIGVAERNQEGVLLNLRPALKSVGGVARINYETHCASEDGEPIDFLGLQRVKAQSAPADVGGIAAVREVFKHDSTVRVSNGAAGIINITIGNPPTEILKTKIRVVRFDSGQQYTAILALGGILSMPEVRKAMERRRFEVPIISANMPVSLPEKNLPHLPPELRSLTIEDALDVVAKTFHGIVAYGVCTVKDGRHNIWFNFIGGKQ
jgi:hypothetical protein